MPNTLFAAIGLLSIRIADSKYALTHVILLLSVVTDDNVDFLAPDIKGGENGTRQFSHGRRKKVMARLYNWEFRKQHAAPSVRSCRRPIVRIHSCNYENQIE